MKQDYVDVSQLFLSAAVSNDKVDYYQAVIAFLASLAILQKHVCDSPLAVSEEQDADVATSVGVPADIEAYYYQYSICWDGSDQQRRQVEDSTERSATTPQEGKGAWHTGGVLHQVQEAPIKDQDYDCRRNCNVQSQPPAMCGGRMVHLFRPGTHVCVSQRCVSSEQAQQLQKIGFELGHCWE